MYLLLCYLLIPAYWKGSLYTMRDIPPIHLLYLVCPPRLAVASFFRHVFMLSTICNARISGTHLPLDALWSVGHREVLVRYLSSFLPFMFACPIPPLLHLTLLYFTSLHFIPTTCLMYIFTAVDGSKGHSV